MAFEAATAPDRVAEPAVADPAVDLATAADPDADTATRTRDLILAGNTPAAVARVRGLTERTIEDHLAELVRRGELTPEEATGLEAEALAPVRQVIEAQLEAGGERRLRPVFDALDGRFSYAVIKCVMAAQG